MKKNVQVQTSETAQPVHHPLTQEVMGEIVSKVYQGENVQRHTFVTPTREYRLGPTTEQFQFFDWPQIFQPVLDEGFTVNKLTVSRGGLRMHAVLSNPDGPLYDDPMVWDTGWGTSQGLRDSIVIHGGLRPGSGFHYVRGFFRLVCTNGLTIETLGLGKADFNHVNFSQETLADQLFGVKTIIGTEQIYGQSIGTKAGLKKTTGLIKRALTEDQAEVPQYVRELLNPLTELPGAFLDKAFEQFAMLIQNSARKQVFEMDIANALTSAQNRLEKAPARLAFKILPAQRSLAKLTGIFSL